MTDSFEDLLTQAMRGVKHISKKLSYGTAGFRDRADLPLNSIFIRMGLFAALRSIVCSSDCSDAKVKCVGVMITASHNPPQDNGIKIVDSDGGMLTSTWEPYAEEIANVEPSSLYKALQRVGEANGIPDLNLINCNSIVLVGRDTRSHSAELSHCVEKGVCCIGGRFIDFGEVTTPQLHFCVSLFNSMNSTTDMDCMSSDEVASLLLSIYYGTLLEGFQRLCATAPAFKTNDAFSTNTITIDAANGVGSISLAEFSRFYHAHTESDTINLNLLCYNKTGDGPVNDKCGAELVQKNQQKPLIGKLVGYNDGDSRAYVNELFCSFDGDADRIVFHGSIDDGHGGCRWILIDGDKIAALISQLLVREMAELVDLAGPAAFACTVGVVQTAYANGASTRFLQSIGVQTSMAKTGVKYLHHKALEFDVGIYFEANGHGTVIFSERFQAALATWPCECMAVERLQASVQLINQCVGDALSDMLYCLAALKVLGYTMEQWDALYCDLPSKQQKVAVRNKERVLCSEDETRVLQPKELQVELDAAMQSVTLGRCFVRPSGTEDVVRIYAEAATREEADQLARETHNIILKYLS